MQVEERSREIQELQDVLAEGAAEYKAAIDKGNRLDVLGAELARVKKREEVMIYTHHVVENLYPFHQDRSLTL